MNLKNILLVNEGNSRFFWQNAMLILPLTLRDYLAVIMNSFEYFMTQNEA